jgi:hypothetical protein
MIEFDDTDYTGDARFNWDNAEGQEGMMETYGASFDAVRDQYKEHGRTVWTIIDGDEDDNLYIVAGITSVNRVNYFITNEKWEDEDEMYIWFNSEEMSD